MVNMKTNKRVISRRKFLRNTGLLAAAAAGGTLTLGPDDARAAATQSTTLPDYERYDGIGLAELVKTRQVSAQELLDAAIERVDVRNPALNAIVSLDIRSPSLHLPRMLKPSSIFTETSPCRNENYRSPMTRRGYHATTSFA